MESAADAARRDAWVICLCAEWCGVCREWRAAFERAAADHGDVRFAWIDVEDEAAAMGDVDVETFPTLLIADAGTPVFFGHVLPSAAQFSRLLASLLQDRSAATAVAAQAAPLFHRLAAVLRNS